MAPCEWFKILSGEHEGRWHLAGWQGSAIKGEDLSLPGGAQDRTGGSGETGELPRRLTQDEYVRLCRRAFENLPDGTRVTFNDVDAILAWCLPEWMLPRE